MTHFLTVRCASFWTQPMALGLDSRPVIYTDPTLSDFGMFGPT